MKKKPPDPLTLGPFLDEREQRINADHEWCASDPEVRRKYGGKIVAVYKRTILGTGKTYAAAWAAAQRRRSCPPKQEVAMVVVPYPLQGESAAKE
jgi:hypothetical protein